DMTYTAMANPSLPFSTANLDSSYYYRIVTTNSNMQACDTISKTIYVAHPRVVETFDSTICDAGTVTLVAHGNPGETVFWYDDINSLTPIHTGDTFVTPYITNTTEYFVESGVGTPQPPATWVNTGTQSVSGNNPNPFYTFYWSNKMQTM